MVTITVLNDNTPGRGMLSEHGLSFHIQTDDRKILLDAGPGDVFKKNADKLGIDLYDIDAVVLSHGHWDHGNGFKYLPSLPLYAHPAVFKKRYHKERNEDYVGLDFNRADFEERFDLHITDKPFQLGRNIWFLGEIPRLNKFESKSTAFIDEAGTEDYIPDDTGVAVRTKGGLIVISGCAHAGIVNTINHAQKVTGIEKVRAVMGGFHLKKADEVTRQTIREIKQLDIKEVYPSHCTDLPALAMFFNTFGMNQVRTGDVLTFE
ncbi:MBL fold metallo-hydrolase [Saccharicrinis sp. FJH62]|uniref:MBL fold metallo-hydrolase n=1 Tax=Saccharicrinis sp. FJH62 TaxID=3344657 RepID=UPI0035D41372